jgi:hypothetical protein
MKTSPVQPILCVVALLMASGLAVAQAYPRPNVYPLSWELGLEYSQLKRVLIRPRGSDQPQAFWYVTFTVTNPGRDEQRFLPVLEMLTDTGSVIRSDRDIPPVVLETIRLRERNRDLQSISEIAGTLRPGADQAKDGVAIWREPMARMGQFSIFVKGLSGERAYLKDAEGNLVKTRQPDGKEEPVVLFKTLQIRYHTVDETWVMR